MHRTTSSADRRSWALRDVIPSLLGGSEDPWLSVSVFRRSHSSAVSAAVETSMSPLIHQHTRHLLRFS